MERMKLSHLLDMEMVSTPAGAEVVGQVYLSESKCRFPVEVRYLDVTGEQKTVTVRQPVVDVVGRMFYDDWVGGDPK